MEFDTTIEKDRHYICEIGRLFWGDNKQCYAADAVYREVQRRYTVAAYKEVLMPKELTADNGAKALLIGEFFETMGMQCPYCDGDDSDPGCEICAGKVQYNQHVPVSWTTIKDIYKIAVEHFSSQQPGTPDSKECVCPWKNIDCNHNDAGLCGHQPDTADLTETIRKAQVTAGEQVVCDNLKKLGF